MYMPVFSNALHQSHVFVLHFVPHTHVEQYVETMNMQNSTAVAKITFLARGAHFGSDC